MKKIILILLLLLNVVFVTAKAAEAFMVQRIEIEGLQRISADTVYSYLPIKPGQTLRPDKTAAIIKALYDTGFFERVTLARQNNILIIKVTERPTIGQLKISGNSVIQKDKLTSVMNSVDVAEGRGYNRAVLDKIKQSLLNQYYQLGRYNARVDVTVSPMSRNRVLVKIDISEGLVAKVRGINIIGNHAFTEKQLDKSLTITQANILTSIITFFTQTDRYSQEKLETSLENLRNFYLDHGYVKFSVKSSQVAITPDRKSIFVTIVIDEGVPYKVKGVDLTGDLILPRDQLLTRITIKPGDTFSRQKVVDSEKAINGALGDKGYIFAEISLNPTLDDVNKQIFLTFVVKPGKRSYVRYITFSENAKTNDEVLRRGMEQMESSVVSTSKLDEGKHRLKLLPYIKDVDMSIQPVPGTDDQVDINYKVVEDSPGQFNFNIGYSQLDHVILGAGFNQKNFLGTGKTFGLNFTRSKVQQFYGMSFTDPYYTPDGISRTINISESTFDARNANITSSYSTNQFDASVVYGIPIGQEKDIFNRIQLGYGYENTLVKLNSSRTISQQVSEFVDDHGRRFQQLDLIAGFSRDSRDKSIFPTNGMIHTVALNVYLPVTGESLKYYTLFYNTKWYHPLTGKLIATARGDLGYGNSFDGATNFPFFKNYYSGGINSVRGFDDNTLGPRDSNDQASGGNFLADGSVGIIFPNYISENLRTTVFIDGGNVYDTFDNHQFGGTGSGSLHYSAGIEADYLVPFLGLIDVSLAKPINHQSGDKQRFFQFALGANFG